MRTRRFKHQLVNRHRGLRRHRIRKEVTDMQQR